jgi:acetolactate synthase-1/2/3 large subunit
MLTEADRARIDERFQIIKDRHETQREQARQLALRHGRGATITPQWLSYCLNEAIGEDSIVLDECVTNSGTVAEYVKRSQPATYFKSGGSSLGWALGASLGAKLSRPDKLVVNTVGDGSFIYGCPTSTLWSADVFNAPFLTVIYNNQVHFAAKRSLQGGYPDGYSEKAQTWIGTDLSPSVEFSMIAQACRAYGEKVESPEQVRPAIDRAIEQVQSGKAAVLDVRIERP